MIINKEIVPVYKEAGKKLHKLLREVEKKALPGVSTQELEDFAREYIKDDDVRPIFLNYTPQGAPRPFPAMLCVSINDELVHGIPNESPKILSEGDIVTVDSGLEYKGYMVDSAISFIIGKGDAVAQRLVEVTKKALDYALCSATAGNTTGDIGHTIESYVVDQGFTIPPEFGGHGIGTTPHEEPFIPNIGDPGQGDVLKEYQVIAIEPIVFEGSDFGTTLDDDGYTYRTRDGSRSAHFEHTIVIQEGAPIILT